MRVGHFAGAQRCVCAAVGRQRVAGNRCGNAAVNIASSTAAPVPPIRGIGVDLRSAFNATAVLAASIDTLSLAYRLRADARHMAEIAQVTTQA